METRSPLVPASQNLFPSLGDTGGAPPSVSPLAAVLQYGRDWPAQGRRLRLLNEWTAVAGARSRLDLLTALWVSGEGAGGKAPGST